MTPSLRLSLKASLVLLLGVVAWVQPSKASARTICGVTYWCRDDCVLTGIQCDPWACPDALCFTHTTQCPGQIMIGCPAPE
jgi:hypothetical protein